MDFSKLIPTKRDSVETNVPVSNNIPDFKLTDHQQEKFNEVIKLLEQGHKRILLLGSAGCGKTVLAGALVKHCKKSHTINTNYNNGSIFVLAPTNKALAVLKSKVPYSVEFKTTHSACKLKRVTDHRSDAVKFIKDKYYDRNDPFPKCKIAINDECSMLNSHFIGGSEDMIRDGYRGYMDDYNFPIIFIGDDKQLNPVGEPFSPVFHQGWPVVELTEIVRQGEGNPIISLSRDLDMIFFKEPSIINGKGYTYLDSKASIIEDLAEVNGTDEMKYLAYVNADVDEMNQLVRERRYGNPKRIELGETIVFNSPFESFYTNKEVKVEQVETIIDNIPIPKYNTRYDRDGKPINETDFVKMKYYRINESFNVVHEDSDLMYKSILDHIVYNCKNNGWSYKGKFFFVEMFADIKYNHAITVHKSQGSTYHTAIVNVGNIMFNKNIEERTRMLYTAVTRPSHVLLLNNVK